MEEQQSTAENATVLARITCGRLPGQCFIRFVTDEKKLLFVAWIHGDCVVCNAVMISGSIAKVSLESAGYPGPFPYIDVLDPRSLGLVEIQTDWKPSEEVINLAQLTISRAQ